MAQFTGYLTDEVVEDYADGILSRREALRHRSPRRSPSPASGHAFFNDTGARYSPTAAAAAYQKLTAWFATHLG